MLFSKKATSAQLMEQLQHNQKAYQKQPQVNLLGKEEILNKPRGQLKMKELRQIRFWRKVGMGVKTPKEAILGVYVDKNCPFTGSIKMRGRTFKGIVKATKMRRTISVRRDYLHFVRKYRRYERRHKNISVHCSPCFRPKAGDVVIFGECRPVSKTVKHNVLKVVPVTRKRTVFEG